MEISMSTSSMSTVVLLMMKGNIEDEVSEQQSALLLNESNLALAVLVLRAPHTGASSSGPPALNLDL